MYRNYIINNFQSFKCFFKPKFKVIILNLVIFYLANRQLALKTKSWY